MQKLTAKLLEMMASKENDQVIQESAGISTGES